MACRDCLTRRDFLKAGGAAAAGLALCACGRDPTAAPSDPGAPTPTPRASNSPQPRCTDPTSLSQSPPTQGHSYVATVPDTFDLQVRAELAVHAMTECTDPTHAYAPYDNMYLWSHPPFLRGTTMANGKYMEAMALLRHATGSLVNRHVDQSWRTAFLQTIGDYPWWGVDGGRLLAWLGNNIRMEQDPCWMDLAQRAIARLRWAMVHREDYSFYPAQDGGMPTGWEATWAGWVLQGLTVLYSATLDPDSLDLARRVARYLKDHAQVFDGDGRFLARHPSERGPALHFHHNGNALEAMSAFAALTGDDEFGRFSKNSYEWARSMGAPLVGFFPEYIVDWPDDRPYVDCEACCTADMIQIALNLCQAGQGNYWDDVDRYVRNQFAEMQLMRTDWIGPMVEGLPPRQPEAGEDADRVAERILGSFASWSAPNDWYHETSPGTTFCCIGNGGRTLYYVWEKMIERRGRNLRVNLLLNRASAWADIHSYLPYQGRVDILPKTECELEVRIPEWTQPRDIAAWVDGAPRETRIDGRVARIGEVERGSLVTLAFPISERVESVVIGDRPYTLVIKGNDVVSIDPSGRWCPFYQRAHYRSDETRWVEVERFVPAE